MKQIKIQRENIGIAGVDSMIEGGLPHESIIGLTGPPGVGKSIFSMHFLLEGARKGQKCVYINLEEPRSNIDKMVQEFGFAKEFFELEKKGLIVIKCYSYLEYEQIHLDLFEKIKEDNKIKRLVVDSFNCFFRSLDNPHSFKSDVNVRKLISSSFYQLRKKELTTLLILEKHGAKDYFAYNIPYLIDGMIKLDFLDLGTIERRIFIPKMRWTNQHKESKSYEIGSNGIEVIEEEI